MPSLADTKIAQLAIARGLVSLEKLLLAATESGNRDVSVLDVLVGRGELTQKQVADLRMRVENAPADAVSRELEQGNTIVMEELHRTEEEAHKTADQSPFLGVGDIDLSMAGRNRYATSDELGRGGMGIVSLARDVILQRDVAIKELLDPSDEKARNRLMLEAQVTGLLDHPSIVPVYDLQCDEDGDPFYTMRVVEEPSLAALLDEVRAGESKHSLAFFVGVLRQVALAVQYAHLRGIVHRDLKPENILVGEFGEVYVIDWGIAKVVRARLGLHTTEKMVMGALVGTPLFMSPEQARGDNDAVDERSDVYSLGAILYELLTLKLMFDADHVLAILFQVVNEAPVPPSQAAPDRNIPTVLEEICLKAVEKAPADRYASAQAFADELELFLEGAKERERREQMAADAVMEAEQVRAVYEDVRKQYVRTQADLEEMRSGMASWAPMSQKETLWDLEQEAEDLSVEIERRFGDTVRAYGQALTHRPEHPAARSALASLYWQRFEEAEASRNLANAAYFEGLVRQYNDGEFDALLEGAGKLSLTTHPAGASVQLYRYQPVKRRLVEWHVADLGTTPVHEVTIAHGSYVCEVACDGYSSMMLPVVVPRAGAQTFEVTLVPKESMRDGFVVVAGVSGGSPDHSSSEPVAPELETFAIKAHPVTCAEYVEFLNALTPERAKARAPRIRNESASLLPVDENGRYYIPEVDAEGDEWDARWPIFLVSYEDAVAYASWLSEVEGVHFRLPTAEEWERAARGADGRVYPWGNHFDARFCRMRDSTKGKPLPAPVGEYSVDRSPYGAFDMAGNIAEWTETDAGSDKVLKGASYNSFALMTRIDNYMMSPRYFRYTHYGFRLVLEV